jgi:hypothetical protein
MTQPECDQKNMIFQSKECGTFQPPMSQQSIARLYEYVFWAGSQAGHWWSKKGNHRTVEMIRGLAAALSKVDQMVVAKAAARISPCWQFFPRESPNLLSTPVLQNVDISFSLVRHYGSFISTVAGGDCHSMCGLRRQS